MHKVEKQWDVENTKTGQVWDINYARMFEKSQSDILLLKFILAAAFYPRYLISYPQDKVFSFFFFFFSN